MNCFHKENYYKSPARDPSCPLCYEALEHKIEELKKHTAHHYKCSIDGRDKIPCDCGLDKLLEET